MAEATLPENEDPSMQDIAPEAPAEPEVKITLSLPVDDPDTETLFFDQLANSDPSRGFDIANILDQDPALEESADGLQDITETPTPAPVSDEVIESSDQPAPEPAVDDMIESDVMLDLELGPAPPPLENKADDEETDTPGASTGEVQS